MARPKKKIETETPAAESAPQNEIVSAGYCPECGLALVGDRCAASLPPDDRPAELRHAPNCGYGAT